MKSFKLILKAAVFCFSVSAGLLAIIFLIKYICIIAGVEQ